MIKWMDELIEYSIVAAEKAQDIVKDKIKLINYVIPARWECLKGPNWL